MLAIRKRGKVKPPLVTVVVPNYNYARYLPQTLDSILQQTWPQLEIIVVDDGSVDDSATILDSYGTQIRWVRQQNQGVAVARNRGASEAQGELIAFLDADDIWLPTKIQSQVERFCADPELGLIHCGLIEFNEQDGDLMTKLDGMEGWVANDLLLLQRSVVHGVGSSGLVPRKIFESVGGFDPRLSTSADWDFTYRIASQQRIGFVSQALVRYRIHSSNMHSNINVMERDMLLGFHKAFSDANAEVQGLRRRAYAKLHLILAGSYFQARQTRDFLRHFARSLLFSTEGIGYVLKYPFRQWERLKVNK